MALIQCPDCGNMISENADSCPKCGYSLKAKRELLEKTRIEELKRKKDKIHVLEFFICLFAIVCFFIFLGFSSPSLSFGEIFMNLVIFITSFSYIILPVVIILLLIILILKK